LHTILQIDKSTFSLLIDLFLKECDYHHHIILIDTMSKNF